MKQKSLRKIESLMGGLVHLGGMLPPGSTDIQELTRGLARLRDKIHSGSIVWPKSEKKK